jgi:hypothetical protein
MKYQALALLFLLSTLATGCGDPDANVVARIQWRLNYGDWTDDSQNAADDLRGCDNQPDDRYAGMDENPYPPIHSVRIFVEDPLGQVPNSDKEYECESGLGSSSVELLGMIRQLYDITVEAKDADGNTLYRHKEEDVDLGVLKTHSYELKAATSETTFFAYYGDSPDCPEGLSSVKYSLYTPEAKRDPEGAPSFQNTTTQHCSSGTSDTIYARGVPVSPEPGSNNKYNPTMYHLKVEALDSQDDIAYCGWGITPRAFRPGSNVNGNRSGNITLTTGACN